MSTTIRVKAHNQLAKTVVGTMITFTGTAYVVGVEAELVDVGDGMAMPTDVRTVTLEVTAIAPTLGELEAQTA